MKLWHLTQNKNTGYDTYSDCVVAAETEEQARVIWPSGATVIRCTTEEWWDTHYSTNSVSWENDEWAKPEFVIVRLIGEAVEGTEESVICASYHAG